MAAARVAWIAVTQYTQRLMVTFFMFFLDGG
jgi:hypothetical protein